MPDLIQQTLAKTRFNPSRVRLEDFLKEAAAQIPAGARVLDAGAGEGQYRPLFTHVRYEAMDFCKVDKAYGRIDVIANLAALPAASVQYDHVICTQVLEHLPEPRAVLDELYRVLKPGGKLWLSAPFFFQEHEVPYDFYRYTRYGLRHLLEGAGFQVERIDWMEGYYGSLSYQFETAGRALPVRWQAYAATPLRGCLPAAMALGLKPFFRVLARVFARLEISHKYDTAGFGKNFIAVAQKPSD